MSSVPRVVIDDDNRLHSLTPNRWHWLSVCMGLHAVGLPQGTESDPLPEKFATFAVERLGVTRVSAEQLEALRERARQAQGRARRGVPTRYVRRCRWEGV